MLVSFKVRQERHGDLGEGEHEQRHRETQCWMQHILWEGGWTWLGEKRWVLWFDGHTVGTDDTSMRNELVGASVPVVLLAVLAEWDWNPYWMCWMQSQHGLSWCSLENLFSYLQDKGGPGSCSWPVGPFLLSHVHLPKSQNLKVQKWWLTQLPLGPWSPLVRISCLASPV